MMEGLTVGHFSVDSQGTLTELTRVKLSGRSQLNRAVTCYGMVWAGPNSLAILTGDLTVRIWDIDNNDNYLLPISMKNYAGSERKEELNEQFTCISYCKMNQTLCAGTNIGCLYFWNKCKTPKLENPEDSWELTNVSSLPGNIKQVMWGSIHLRLPLLSINCVTKVYIMKEQEICVAYSGKIWATQKAATQVLLETCDSDYLLQSEMQVTNVSLNENYVALTNGRLIAIYEITWADSKFELNSKLESKSKLESASKLTKETQMKFSINPFNTINCDNESLLLNAKNIIILFVTGVTIRTVNGLIIANIPVMPAEGEPIGMDLCNNFLTIFTIDGFLKIYDVSESDPKLITGVRSLYDMCTDFGEIIQAKCNSSGTKVAMTLAASNLIPDGKLYIWNIEQDNMSEYDFKKSDKAKKHSFESESGDYLDEEEKNEAEINSPEVMSDKICSNRMPLNIFWDGEDPRLLICDAKKLKASKEKVKFFSSLHKIKASKEKGGMEDEDHIIVTMFVSSDGNIKIHDIKPLDLDGKLLGLFTPYVICLKKLCIVREVMNDFVGLEDCSKSTRDAVLDFSYNLSLGKY